MFPPADAALPSSMLSIGDTVISGICVAVALCIVVQRGSKNHFLNYAFLRYTVSLAVIIIIMNWFQAVKGDGRPALQCVASGLIGFVAVHCLRNGEVMGDTIQPMSKVWDWNMYGTKLKKLHGWFLNTGNEDGGGGEVNAKAIVLDDGGDGPKDGSSGSDDQDDHEDDAVVLGDKIESCVRAVQLLAIRANFHVTAINAYDWHQGRSIYRELEGEEQEEGMDLVLTGPYRILEAYGSLCIKVFTLDDEGSSTDDEGYSTDDEGSPTAPLFETWDVSDPEKVEKYTNIIFGFFGRMVEITYLVIPDAIETHVEVRLNLEDLGSRSRDVFGSVKASAIAYGSKSVHLFSCERWRSLSVPCGSTFTLPLRPYIIALPCNEHFELQIEVDLRVITTSDNQEEDKSLKFCLDCSHRSRSEERVVFPRRIRSHKREVDGDQVEVNVAWSLERDY